MNAPVAAVNDILANLPQFMDVEWPHRLLPCAICKHLIQIDAPFFVVFTVNGIVTAQIHCACKES